MSFFKQLFNTKETKLRDHKDFWNWFTANEKKFYSVVKSGKNTENEFFDKLSPKLEELKPGIYYVVGISKEGVVDLVLTPDGVLKNILFIEELVNAAPALHNWKFTALKSAIAIENLSIKMADFTFNNENLSFYPIEHSNQPDEVDIVIVYHDYKEEYQTIIVNGSFVFLDNYLGELKSVTTIDNAVVIGKDEATKELIPIAKLQSYLIWREKEFIEKYEGLRYNTENDSFSSLEAELDNGNFLIATINATLLEWDSKASHPWILQVMVNYDGNSNNGMPDTTTYELMNQMEDEIMDQLKDFEGYLNIGRQTADNSREIYFACQEFRNPSKVLDQIIKKYDGQLAINYDLYKDKYWQSFERFRMN
ncbi:DUF695 domain-containing protein [Flavobacterium algicola]|uniref:DUF695 domain-containing protein n=1 Tax=Flavobacterium algicola TaxID=556529 RepID=UPI001EFDE3D4|nr:DUF695 domain-containing protein [Flavobacterium algicola]MCG9791043.1 DUF695 domain-containing protein [Flavobacterium algicola]